MGEKYDTPTGVPAQGAGGAGTAAAAGAPAVGHPSTAEKPGTGKEKEQKGEVRRPRDIDRDLSWTGSVTYPDGFTMGRNADGSTALTAPDGSRGLWNDVLEKWLDPETMAPKEEGWGEGHRPTDFGEGRGSTSTGVGPMNEPSGPGSSDPI
jgi:hypothetical protein